MTQPKPPPPDTRFLLSTLPNIVWPDPTEYERVVDRMVQEHLRRTGQVVDGKKEEQEEPDGR